MPIVDDNSIASQYIRSIENPDSIGYSLGRWYQSPRNVDDPNNRGFGVDITYNNDAKELTNNRLGQWLSELEERELRNKHIGYAEEILGKWTPKALNKEPSEVKKAMAEGMIYRGDGVKAILKNTTLRDTYYSGSDEDFKKAVSDYYNKKGLSRRADLHDSFTIQKTPWSKYSNKKGEGGSLNTKDWNSLSLRDKSDIIKVAINNGITTLPEIKEAYNKFADGGDTKDKDYEVWLDTMSKYKGLNKEDPDYDYKVFYESNPKNAWDLLEDNPDAHFSDIGKKPTHPTFSNKSIYSTHAYRGGSWIEGGTFSPHSWQYKLSEDQLKHKWDIGRTLDYVTDAENNGIEVLYPNGIHVRDAEGNVFGGVLPEVNASYADGGNIHIKPSHKGRFTELKKRTGHSTSWFLENGTPKQKKMANFARNASHWNHHTNGGNLFLDGGYIPSDSIKSSIAGYEGKAMTQSTIDPLSHKKVAKNNSLKSEAKGFTNALPEDIRDKVLANPELADWLYHYSYNVGAGNFKNRVVPSLRNYFNGKATIDDVTNSMWASGDSKLRGLQRRRAEEKQGVKNALLGIHIDPSTYQIPQEFFDSINASINLPYTQETYLNEDPALAYKAPQIDSTLFETPKSIVETPVYNNPTQERLDRLHAINNVFAMMGEKSPLENYSKILQYDNPLIAIANMNSYRGNLYDAGGQKNVYTDGNGEYYALQDDNRTKIPLTRYGKFGQDADPSTWQFSDEEGEIYSPHGTHYGENRVPVEKGLEIVSPEFDLLSLSPLIKRAAKYGAIKLADAATTYKPIQNIIDNGTLWDSYTTLGGRIGSYGDNPISNIYGTLARNFNLPDKARIPSDAIRKLKGDINIDNGLVDLTGTKFYKGNPHINATLDRPVVSHKWGQWDGADTYIFSTKSFLNQTYPNALKSVEPSDIFANGTKVFEKPNNVTLISGDVDALNKARKIGMQIVSSPRLRTLYESSNASNPKEIAWFPEYAAEVQRLQARRGTPTLEDFKLLENTTGLKTGVAPLSEYDNAINGLEDMNYTIFNRPISDIVEGKAKSYIYPNGREVEWSIGGIKDELDILHNSKYNKVFYDPTTHVESEWIQK